MIIKDLVFISKIWDPAPDNRNVRQCHKMTSNLNNDFKGIFDNSNVIKVILRENKYFKNKTKSAIVQKQQN